MLQVDLNEAAQFRLELVVRTSLRCRSHIILGLSEGV